MERFLVFFTSRIKYVTVLYDYDGCTVLATVIGNHAVVKRKKTINDIIICHYDIPPLSSCHIVLFNNNGRELFSFFFHTGRSE